LHICKHKSKSPNPMKTPTCGVYMITCLPTGQVYIGASVNTESRYSGHRSQLKSGKHINKAFLELFNQYGELAFEYKVVELCNPTRGELSHCEQKWMDIYSGVLINSVKIARNAGPMKPETAARIKDRKEREMNEYRLSWAEEALKKNIKSAREIIKTMRDLNFSKEMLLQIIEEEYNLLTAIA